MQSGAADANTNRAFLNRRILRIGFRIIDLAKQRNDFLNLIPEHAPQIFLKVLAAAFII